MRAGDLIIVNLPDGDAHVVMYLGGGQILHDSPSSPTGGVGVNNLNDMNEGYHKTWMQLFKWGNTRVRRVA